MNITLTKQLKVKLRHLPLFHACHPKELLLIASHTPESSTGLDKNALVGVS